MRCRPHRFEAHACDVQRRHAPSHHTHDTHTTRLSQIGLRALTTTSPCVLSRGLLLCASSGAGRVAVPKLHLRHTYLQVEDVSLYLEAARTDATLAQAGAVAFLIKPSEMKHGARALRRAGRSRPPVPVRVALTQLAKGSPPPGSMDEDRDSGPLQRHEAHAAWATQMRQQVRQPARAALKYHSDAKDSQHTLQARHRHCQGKCSSAYPLLRFTSPPSMRRRASLPRQRCAERWRCRAASPSFSTRLAAWATSCASAAARRPTSPPG